MSAMALGALRLKFGDSFIIAAPPDEPGKPYDIRVTDWLGIDVSDEDRKAALRFLLRELSDVRSQVWSEVGGDEVLT